MNMTPKINHLAPVESMIQDFTYFMNQNTKSFIIKRHISESFAYYFGFKSFLNFEILNEELCNAKLIGHSMYAVDFRFNHDLARINVFNSLRNTGMDSISAYEISENALKFMQRKDVGLLNFYNIRNTSRKRLQSIRACETAFTYNFLEALVDKICLKYGASSFDIDYNLFNEILASFLGFASSNSLIHALKQLFLINIRTPDQLKHGTYLRYKGAFLLNAPNLENRVSANYKTLDLFNRFAEINNLCIGTLCEILDDLVGFEKS